MEFKVTVARKTDVLVVGGGCAGLAAAICAARHGAKVLLAEAGSCLGGMGTAGLVGPFMTCYDPAGERQVIKGIYDEFVRRMAARKGAIPPEDCHAGDSYCGYRIPGHDHCASFSAFMAVAFACAMSCAESAVSCRNTVSSETPSGRIISSGMSA